MTDDATPPATTPEEPPTAARRGLVVVLNRALFAAVLRTAGCAVAIVPPPGAFLHSLQTSDTPAVLGIIALGAGPDWDQIRPLLANDAVTTPILAFGPHKDVAAMRAAKAAGVTRL